MTKIEGTQNDGLIDGIDVIAYAIREIKKTYGDDVSAFEKGKPLYKFGWNQAVGSSGQSTIQEFAGSETEETLLTTNGIDTVSSDDAANTQVVTIEGHTIDGEDLTFVVQNATLDGQNKVTLTTPLARATRIYNADSTPLAASSKVFVYEDGNITTGTPNDTATVHLMMTADDNQSQKCATAVSSLDYWIITEFGASLNKKTAATVDVRIKIKRPGGVFRATFMPVSLKTDGQSEALFLLRPAIIVPKNSDVKMTAIASTTGVSVSAFMNGYLALIQ